MSRHNASQAPEDAASVPQRATNSSLNSTFDFSDSPKTYHATAEWGKRGMTLQELTRAFDAFNEAEERVALGFAGSEDCNRTLAEPLSEVKTIFLDLDGLKPLSGYPSFQPTSSVAASSQRNNVSYLSQVNPDTNARERNELDYIMRTESVPSYSNASRTHERHHNIELDFRVNEDTIKLSQKRRSLLTTFPLGMSSRYTLKFEDEPDAGIPARPPSRLGFIEDGNVDEYGRESGGDTL